MRLVPMTSGTVIFEGTEISSLNGVQAARAAPGPADDLPGPDLLAQPAPADRRHRRRAARDLGQGRTSAGAVVDKVLDAVGLDPEIARPKRRHEFSGGQCQRICIARALVLDPKVIICDEPVSALDVSVQAQILNLLEDMKERYGLTLVFIAHDLAVVKNVSDRVAVMYLGKICEVAAPDDLYQPARRTPTPLRCCRRSRCPTPPWCPTTVALDGDLPSPLDPPSGCRFRTRCPRAEERCAAEEPQMREIGPGPLRGLPLPARRASVAPPEASVRWRSGPSGERSAGGGTEAVVSEQRPRSRTRLDPAVRRRQIAEAAARVFAEHDPSEVSFELIADEAGVSRSLVYSYFGDRGSLFAAGVQPRARAPRRRDRRRPRVPRLRPRAPGPGRVRLPRLRLAPPQLVAAHRVGELVAPPRRARGDPGPHRPHRRLHHRHARGPPAGPRASSGCSRPRPSTPSRTTTSTPTAWPSCSPRSSGTGCRPSTAMAAAVPEGPRRQAARSRAEGESTHVTAPCGGGAARTDPRWDATVRYTYSRSPWPSPTTCRSTSTPSTRSPSRPTRARSSASSTRSSRRRP